MQEEAWDMPIAFGVSDSIGSSVSGMGEAVLDS